MKRNVSNVQLVYRCMRQITDGIQQKKLVVRQLSQSLDINGTGYLTRAEFSKICQRLCEDLSIEHIRLVTQFFDDRDLGRVSVMEFVRVCMEILNQNIGGGVYAYL